MLCARRACVIISATAPRRIMTRAVSYFRRAAERGHVRAMTRLGVCYETGHGAQQDPQQAETLYRRSAGALGTRRANTVWRRCCGGERIPTPTGGRPSAEAAAAAGMPRASICWAPATKPATVWRKSPNTPCTCTSRPPSRDTRRPWCGWGICYETGSGVAQDPAVAANLYRQAAERGNGLALCRLGRLYERGTGVRRDLRQAADLYEKGKQATFRAGPSGRSGVLGLPLPPRGGQKNPSAASWTAEGKS